MNRKNRFRDSENQDTRDEFGLDGYKGEKENGEKVFDDSKETEKKNFQKLILWLGRLWYWQ